MTPEYIVLREASSVIWDCTPLFLLDKCKRTYNFYTSGNYRSEINILGFALTFRTLRALINGTENIRERCSSCHLPVISNHRMITYTAVYWERTMISINAVLLSYRRLYPVLYSPVYNVVYHVVCIVRCCMVECYIVL